MQEIMEKVSLFRAALQSTEVPPLLAEKYWYVLLLFIVFFFLKKNVVVSFVSLLI